MEKVADNLIKKVSSGELVPINSLWQSKSLILAFVRRWGWKLCRVWATQLSTLKPQLEAHDIDLVAVGLEEFGVDEFFAGNFLKGDIYLDQDYATYKALNFDRASILSLPKQMLSSDVRKLNSEANSVGISGNMKGDGMQMGGTFVIEKGGKVLFHHKQTGFGDHPKLTDLLSALGLNAEKVEPEPSCQSKW